VQPSDEQGADAGNRPARDPSSRPARSPLVAAFLGFVFPGAGHAWAGRVARGLVFALPIVFLIGVPIGLYVAGGSAAIAGLVIEPNVLIAIIALDVVLTGWPVVAIVDGYLAARRSAARPGRPATRALSTMVVAVLVLVTIATHGAIAFVGYNGYDLVTGVFAAGDGSAPAWGDDDPSYAPEPDDNDDPDATPDPLALDSPSPPPTAPATDSPSPTITPEPVPYWAQDGRLNLVLLGGDSGPGRSSIRTDTMMLLTIDLATNKAALASFPRNLLNTPLPKPHSKAFANGRYPDYLNALWRYADEHPSKRFPGGDKSRGFRAISATLGYLAGVDVDGLAFLDLNGFVKFVDVLGGLDITVPYAIYDARYPKEDGSGYRVLSISAGKHHFDGSGALAFARSRHQDSDYGRMERQQIVLVAIRRQTKVCGLLTQLPKLVRIAKKSMYTNIPLDDLAPFMAIAVKVRSSKIRLLQFTPEFGYPEYVTTSSVLRMRKAIANAFGKSTAAQAPDGSGDPSAGPDLPDLSC